MEAIIKDHIVLAAILFRKQPFAKRNSVLGNKEYVAKRKELLFYKSWHNLSCKQHFRAKKYKTRNFEQIQINKCISKDIYRKIRKENELYQ